MEEYNLIQNKKRRINKYSFKTKTRKTFYLPIGYCYYLKFVQTKLILANPENLSIDYLFDTDLNFISKAFSTNCLIYYLLTGIYISTYRCSFCLD